MDHEYVHAILNAGEFFVQLLDPKRTPKVPRDIRMRARSALKHLPRSEYEFDMMLKSLDVDGAGRAVLRMRDEWRARCAREAVEAELARQVAELQRG